MNYALHDKTMRVDYWLNSVLWDIKHQITDPFVAIAGAVPGRNTGRSSKEDPEAQQT